MIINIVAQKQRSDVQAEIKEADALYSLRVCFVFVFIFSLPDLFLALRCAAQHGDLCNTFPRPDGDVEGDESRRNLPEQSATSRCQLIVSESSGSSSNVPTLPGWKQISSLACVLSRESSSKTLQHNRPNPEEGDGLELTAEQVLLCLTEKKPCSF